MPLHYIYLLAAIITETIGTMALQSSHQFSRFWPSVLSIVSYGVSFYLMSETLRFMPVGIVYAIWSGFGIVLIAAMGFFMFNQRLDLPAVLGMVLIISGILVIHLYSSTSA